MSGVVGVQRLENTSWTSVAASLVSAEADGSSADGSLCIAKAEILGT